MVLGTAGFALYVLFLIAIRIGRFRAPYRLQCKIHFYFSLLWVGLFLGLQATGWFEAEGLATVFSPERFLTGLLVFYLWHYAFFLNFLAAFQRGFSLNICVSIFKNGGSSTVSEILSGYGDGKGLDYVKQERLDVLRQSGAIEVTQANPQLNLREQLHVKWFGRLAVTLNRLVFRVWNLNYIGQQSPNTKVQEVNA